MDRSRYFLVGASLAGACLIGFLTLLTNRILIYSDAISYLDLAHAYLSRPWYENANAIWGPLLPVLLAGAFFLTHPSPRSELFIADGVVFSTYVFVLLAYLFFHQRLQRYLWRRFPAVWSEEKTRAIFLFGFATLVAESSCLLGDSIQPDLLVGGFFILSCGFLLHFQSTALNARGVIGFALVLTLGYLAKGILFPLAWVFIACLYFSQQGKPQRGRYTALLLVLFLAFASVQWLPLSLQKHRLTFSDTGKVNYVWFVPKGDTDWAFRQKNLDGTRLKHPIQIVSDVPRIYAFKGGQGTFPDWYDPSYWMEGLHFTFQPGRQLSVFLLNSQQLLTILSGRMEIVKNQSLGPSLSLVALLSVFFLTAPYKDKDYLARLPWVFLIPPLAGIGAYLLVYILYRYVFSFIFVILIFLFSDLLGRLDLNRMPAVRSISAALFIITFIALLGRSLGDLREQLRTHQNDTLHSLIANPHADAAEALHALGVQKGTPIADLGDLKDAYFIQLAGLNVVSQVSDENLFWKATDAEKEKIYQILLSTGAQDLIVRMPTSPHSLTGWSPIGDSGFLLHALGSAPSPP